MLTQAVYSIGTAATTVVAPVNDYAKYALKNIQPGSVDDMAREGYVYLIGRQFSLTQGATAAFSIETGPTGAQFDFYEIVSDVSNVYAELIEGATVAVTGDPIVAYNLNRNYPDTHASVLKAATSVTGGTTISAEFVTATNQGGGVIASNKIHTLEPNTQYAMKFTNQGAQTTNIFFQLGFSEHYNGYSNIWLEAVNNSFVLKPGDDLVMELPPLATINATSLINGNKLSVMRID